MAGSHGSRCQCGEGTPECDHMPHVLLGTYIAFMPPCLVYLAGAASTTASYAPARNDLGRCRPIGGAPTSNVVTSKRTPEFSVMVYGENPIVKIVYPSIYIRRRTDGGEHRNIARSNDTTHRFCYCRIIYPQNFSMPKTFWIVSVSL